MLWYMGHHEDRKDAVSPAAQSPRAGLESRTGNHDVVNQHNLRLCRHRSHPHMHPSATKTCCPGPRRSCQTTKKVANAETPQ